VLESVRVLSCPEAWSSFLDMGQNRFSIYLMLQAIVIAAVIVIFKVIPDRKIAATIAGVLFVTLPLGLMIYEWSKEKLAHRIWFAGVLQFWILFALPILGLRVFNWETDFSELSFLGVPGATMHAWSSKSYILMMIVTAFTRWYSGRRDAAK
jgi:hypothetical protein